MHKTFFAPLSILCLLALVWSFHPKSETSEVLEEASRSPSSVQNLIERTIEQSILNLKSHFEDASRFTAESCVADSELILRQVENLESIQLNQNELKRNYKSIIEKSYQTRQVLLKRLRDFQSNKMSSFSKSESGQRCVRQVRALLRFFRYVEDYSLLIALNPKPFDASRDPKEGPILRGTSPQLLQTENSPLRLRSGDVLISRGNAYTSAAISRMGKEEAQFSHLSLIYIDAPVGTEVTVEQALQDQRVQTVEAHIEVGSFTRTFAKYVLDGNARVLLFRPLIAADKAHQASQSIFRYVTGYQKTQMNNAKRTKLSVDDNPPYDFKMDSSEKNQIYCSEIVSLAYKAVGLQLPTYSTRLRYNDLTKKMQITANSVFAPADLEIDPNFIQLAEWRDTRKLAALLRKDVVLSSMFDWMEEKKYNFQFNIVDFIKAKTAWRVRQLDLGFFEEKFPKNMNTSIIGMTFVLDRVGQTLEQKLQELDQNVKQEGRPPLVFYEQKRALDLFREQDYNAGQVRESVQFHLDFAPSR